MVSKLVFCIHLKARTPLFFGGAESDQLLRQADGQPMVSGNSLRGLFREWLNRNPDRLENNIRPWMLMGGEKDEDPDDDSEKTPAKSGAKTDGNPTNNSEVQNEEDNDGQTNAFIRSRLVFDHGKLLILKKFRNKKYPEKHGTAIDPATGTALAHAKYRYEYLPEGTRLLFQISCQFGLDDSEITEEDLKKIISDWAVAIQMKDVRFGGKKSIHFGVCEVVSVKWSAFDFHSVQDVDNYLFPEQLNKKDPSRSGTLQIAKVDLKVSVCKMKMEGCFPYGVYIADYDKGTYIVQLEDQSVKATVPASSLKGLIRHDVRRLVIKMLRASGISEHSKLLEGADRYVEWLFGSTNQTGLVIFSDMTIIGREVEVIRPDDNNQNGDSHASDSQSTESNFHPKAPKYIKIDRITGGTVDSQLKTQREIQGAGRIELDIRLPDSSSSTFDPESIWFPLIYALRRIGAGLLPVGGRTSIGLGQFHAHEICIEEDGITRKIPVSGNGQQIGQLTTDWLRQSYDRFREALLNELSLV